jgi:RHS repeat-associated protein
LNRLSTASENSGAIWSQTYGYDRYGNRWISNSFGYTLSSLTPQSQGAFNAANNRLFASVYDGAGNQTGDAQSRTFTYDAENRQTTFNGTVEQYFYDGDGRRVKKTDNSGTTVFVYNAGGQLIAEYHSDPVPPAAGGGGTSYLTSDHLGSTRVVTKSDGTVKARYDYLPFGEELGSGIGQRTVAMGYSAADSTKQKFTQKERDSESGLDYFGTRYYSSAQGRFTSVDPLMASGNAVAPQSWNRFVYTLNNPLRYIDPDGRAPGDFYDEQGKKLGTDGRTDGKIYVVTDDSEAKKIAATDKKGSTTSVDSVSSEIELPSLAVRQEIGTAVDRSNQPTTDDPKGGFHEDGGIWGTLASGQEKVINAQPGAYSDPKVPGGSATVDPTNPANKSEVGVLAGVGGTFHVHPKGEITETSSSSSPGVIIGGTITTKTFNFVQPPSATDISNAQKLGTRYNIVLGARDKKVYLYNGTGTIAKFPLDKFRKVK